MNKPLRLMAIGLSLAATTAWAQDVNTDSIRRSQDDSSDFTFTESQLDDNNDAAQTVSSISSASSDPFLSEVGYRFSPSRFKVRAYDNMYEQTYMNGLQLNDLEQGRFSYSMIGGMNDATRNQESAAAFDYNNFSLTGIGGANHINTRASAFAQGTKFTLSGTNRNYVLRGMATHATGWTKNGWAFAGTLGYRWSKEGVIEGTYYNSFSYILSAQKRFGDNHSLNLVTFGSPTERAQQGASTEEAYWLANSHYYNPYWGYQNGKKRNSRIVYDFEPTAILTWDWKIDDDKKLTTAAGFKYSLYSNSALSYCNNAYNPAPDYYKNFPSSIFNVYDESINNPEYLADHPYYMDQYNTLKDYWTSSKANRQIDWDRLYYVNSIQNQKGETASYFQERRHNDQMVFSLAPTWSHTVNSMLKYTGGIILNHTKGMHYKTMQDLLGANKYIDIDTYAERDYGKGSSEVQNDLRNPNRQIREGDTFGYNYNIFVNKMKAWAQLDCNIGNVNFFAGAFIDETSIEREGLMQNGRAKEYSYGKSGAANFLGGGVKTQLSFRPLANHRISLGGSIESQAPLARNAFVAPRIQNNFVNNLTNEDIASANLSWQFRFGSLTGKLSGYYTRFIDQVEQTGFYNDLDSRFYYVTMSGIDKQHYGIDGALTYQVNSELSFNVMGSWGEAEYINNPFAQLFSENNSTEYRQWTNPVTGDVIPDRIFADGMKVSGTPLTALSAGANYNVNNWYFELALNYYDRSYIGFSQFRRMGYVLSQNNKTASVDPVTGKDYFEMTDEELKTFQEEGGVLFSSNGEIAKVYSPAQEKLKGGFMLDASIGKFIRLRNGKAISINLSLQNINNNTNLQTGGYEQNRSDFYTNGEEKGNAKTYKFSSNPKYYYANPFNAFLNINYRF